MAHGLLKGQTIRKVVVTAALALGIGAGAATAAGATQAGDVGRAVSPGFVVIHNGPVSGTPLSSFSNPPVLTESILGSSQSPATFLPGGRAIPTDPGFSG
jgi:hypothetical protein